MRSTLPSRRNPVHGRHRWLPWLALALLALALTSLGAAGGHPLVQ